MSVLTDNKLTRLLGAGGRERRGRAWRITRWGAVGAVALAIVYLGYMTVVYSVFYDRDIYYPQQVLADFDQPDRIGATSGDLPAGETQECTPSRTIAMQTHLVDLMVNENIWAPARPLYKAGLFGLVDFADTPWFDNKAAEQVGMLDIVRRLGIELTDSLGRVRGTSAENENLSAAQSALRIDMHAWYVNSPFQSEVNTISPSAAASYRKAIPLYEAYNAQLATCEAVFDARTDNLRETLSRFSATLGATIVELAARSKGIAYDVEKDRYVNGEGNNRGWFDFRADNHFHRARGKMFALHGLLQGLRADFNHVITDRNLVAVWDKMEASVAEAALLNPPIVSNGAKDGLIFPDHLGVMAEAILRARTSMVELRDILRD
jgi:hypothetical protein